MSSIVVSGDTSGSCTLVAPAVAGGSVLTLPVATDTLVGKATTDTLTNKTLTSPVINGMGSSILTSGTAQASTSGTSIDFTGIPSWAKRITVMFNGVSTSGTSLKQIQIGSGSIANTGYLAATAALLTSTMASVGITSGYPINSNLAADVLYGAITLSLFDTNKWVASGNTVNGASSFTTAGYVTLSGTLDRVRITTVNGTDTFDAGSINIMYE
jgi:hypothetical protein